jgi:hypothetical protein
MARTGFYREIAIYVDRQFVYHSSHACPDYPEREAWTAWPFFQKPISLRGTTYAPCARCFPDGPHRGHSGPLDRRPRTARLHQVLRERDVWNRWNAGAR